MFAEQDVTGLPPVKKSGRGGSVREAKTPKTEGTPVTIHQYTDSTRKNLPPAGLAVSDKGIVGEKQRFAYDAHLTPVLRFDESGATDEFTDEAQALLTKVQSEPLTAEEAAILGAALRSGQPWLEWAGKREQPTFDVDPVALHIHERVSAQAILAGARREDVQRDLFADPKLDAAQASQFYRHNVDWSNRLILGDSLQVMTSLSRREALAGQVQMIYLDPPYGIKFSSNWQNEVGKRDVKEKDEDLSREPEMIRAYRDTWTLGVHSYLTYLKQRLLLARELLTDTGSIFVQISDENLHRVRAVMDEVFGPENFIGQIGVQKTGGLSADFLITTVDYLLWYAKERTRAKYRQLYLARTAGDTSLDRYDMVEEHSGVLRRISSEESRAEEIRDGRRLQLTSLESANPTTEFEWFDRVFKQRWKTNAEGLKRLALSERIAIGGEKIRYRRYVADFPVIPITDHWESLQIGTELLYVVQTSSTILQRCMLMCTDPGDLVVDPTCGSGTTALVAEQWGRRWITIDSSRVALAIARQRLLTASFDTYKTRDPQAGVDPNHPLNPKHGFRYRSVPHVTLKSIAQNTSLDPIFAKHEPIIAQRLVALNAVLNGVSDALREKLVAKLIEKLRTKGARNVTDADQRRWLLPGTDKQLIQQQRGGPTATQARDLRDAIPPKAEWREWEVPFDIDADWPTTLQDALTAYREAWRAKMKEVNDCISANAEQEELVDQPEPLRGVVRVSGPFTVESIRPLEESMVGPEHDPSPIGGAPEELGSVFEDPAEEGTRRDVTNAANHIDRMIALLRHDGVRFPNNKHLIFERLDPVDAEFIHAEGSPKDQPERRVAVVIGPEHGAVTGYQVERAKISAYQRGYDEVIFAGFAFDAAAQDRIQEAEAIAESGSGGTHFHMAHIRPDVLMGDLLKGNRAGKKAATAQASQQIFTVFGQPRTHLTEKQGEWTMHMEGVDIYDPVKNSLEGTKADKVAAWFLDTDYDGRTFHICQAFFPDKSAWEKLARALGTSVEESVWQTLSGTQSLPFKAGGRQRVAVKVIDPRGNEVMSVHRLESSH
ncbi:DNA methylase N-4/N-6 domain protein [Chthoniobacter flavus Ellin428]|uniref:site-specific DNA-methyltransferase (adenine-specific) n=2 Tax=Chthoniobacter flavus TaxID=191863 RepID=B4CYW4_9BACT|nr:DNA methylase N-4/N-6 domain protein [Chthoniobacter flavus Ellin428]